MKKERIYIFIQTFTIKLNVIAFQPLEDNRVLVILSSFLYWSGRKILPLLMCGQSLPRPRGLLHSSMLLALQFWYSYEPYYVLWLGVPYCIWRYEVFPKHLMSDSTDGFAFTQFRSSCGRICMNWHRRCSRFSSDTRGNYDL